MLSKLPAIMIFVAAIGAAGCLSWSDKQTPAGGRCADMLVVAMGKEAALEGRQVRRIRAIGVSGCGTATECMEALRRRACGYDADVVVEVFSEPEGLSGFAAKYVVGGTGGR